MGQVSVGGDSTVEAVASITLEATIIRANGDVEDLGVVSAYHRDPADYEQYGDRAVGTISVVEEPPCE